LLNKIFKNVLQSHKETKSKKHRIDFVVQPNVVEVDVASNPLSDHDAGLDSQDANQVQSNAIERDQKSLTQNLREETDNEFTGQLDENQPILDGNTYRKLSAFCTSCAFVSQKPQSLQESALSV